MLAHPFAIRHFEDIGRLWKSYNSSFITLILKTKDPSTLHEYCPINLIVCLYKIISKILATWIKKLIGGIIGEEQTTYVHERSILDGPLIINEICSWSKVVNNKILLLKVNFDKVFDSINWEYLFSVMIQMGFGNKRISWIHGCLSSSRTSVNINGAHT